MLADCRLCGVCLNINSMTHLFNEEGNHILGKINYLNCFTFRIGADDGFSPYLCEGCMTLVHSAHEFKLLSEAANSIFADMSQKKSVILNACTNEWYTVDSSDTKYNFFG